MKPTITIFGDYQNGKSTLVNCILKQDIAEVGGQGLAVTKNKVRYTYGEETGACIIKADGSKYNITPNIYPSKIHPDEEIVWTIPNKILLNWDLVDTPGFNANEYDSRVAEETIRTTDFGLMLIHNKGLSESEKEIATKLSAQNIPFIAIINCYNDIFEQWNPQNKNNESIENLIRTELDFPDSSISKQFGNKGVFMVNLIWFWISIDKRYRNSNNLHIAKCDKLIKNFWEDFSDESFNSVELSKMSNFPTLENFLLSSLFNCYIKLLKSYNDGFFKIGELIEGFLMEDKGFYNRHIKEMNKGYEESSRFFRSKKEKEIKEIEKKYYSPSETSYQSSSLFNMIAGAVKKIFSDAPIRIKKAEIEHEKKQTEGIIRILESLKI